MEIMKSHKQQLAAIRPLVDESHDRETWPRDAVHREVADLLDAAVENGHDDDSAVLESLYGDICPRGTASQEARDWFAARGIEA